MRMCPSRSATTWMGWPAFRNIVAVVWRPFGRDPSCWSPAITPALRHRLQSKAARVAVVDDAISAGSSVRATCMALKAAGAQVVAVGALIILGNVGTSHLEAMRLPVERLTHQDSKCGSLRSAAFVKRCNAWNVRPSPGVSVGP